MTFTAPIPFTEALAKLAAREITPSARDSLMWSHVPVAIRERAFFSSRVESARVLQSMNDGIAGWLLADKAIESHGGLRFGGRAEFVADMREIAIREGLGVIDPLTGEINPTIRESDLTDIRSISRLQLIFDTQTEAAQEYGYFAQGQDPAILDVFPAQRFIRVRPVKAPRAYHRAAEGAVRRKDDLPFWVSLNRDFGVPWGPWGFNSGMGVEDVDRNEAIALGIIKKNAVVKPIAKPVAKDLNSGLSAGVLDLFEPIAAALARNTGGSLAAGRLVAAETTIPGTLAERVMPRNTMLDPELVKQRLAALARPDATDITAMMDFPARLPAGKLVTSEDLKSMVRDAGAIFPPELWAGMRKLSLAVKPLSAKTAGTYSKGKITLSEKLLDNPAELRLTILHELTHAVHDDAPGAGPARRTIRSHYDKRTRGETPLTQGGRRYKRDQWWTLEAGLEDGGEVASYYLELIGRPADDFSTYMADAKHRETFELVAKAFGINWKK